MPKVIYRRFVHEGPHVVPNVFHEHAVYLRYICAFYDELPALSLFIHGHHSSWHNTRYELSWGIFPFHGNTTDKLTLATTFTVL